MFETSPQPAPAATMTRVATFIDYRDAAAAIHTLGDAGFDVSAVEISWNGLRRIDRVSGRRSTARVALDGAIAGAWFGAFISIVAAVLFDPRGLVEWIGFLTIYPLIGACVGGVWFALAHRSSHAAWDISTSPTFIADTYDLLVDAAVSAQAASILERPVASARRSIS